MKIAVFYSPSWVKAGTLAMALLGGFTVNSVMAQTTVQTQNVDKQEQEAKALFEEGLQYFDTSKKPSKAEQAKAVEVITKSANMGYAPAQNGLGSMFYFGLMTKQDDAKAFEWFKKAAAQGNIEALYNVGQMYTEGKGVEASEAEAAVWYEKSAAQGYAPAQSYLGILYLFGVGIEKNQDKGMNLLQKAAKQGDQQAIQLLNKLQVPK